MSPGAQQIVSNLTGVLVQAAHPKRIILFGSQARGDAAPYSDFDIMVVEEKPADRFAEMVRLNRLIRSFDIAVDLLVVSDEKFQYWRETPGNVYYEAATAGAGPLSSGVNKLCSLCARRLRTNPCWTPSSSPTR